MPNLLGAFKGRKTIAAFFDDPGGMVCGLLHHHPSEGLVLSDSSGELRLPLGLADLLPGGYSWYWVALNQDETSNWSVSYCQPIDANPWFQKLRERDTVLRTRWHVHQAIRSFFLQRHFLEVDTPIRVPCPGMEPYLDSFEAGGQYLRTSPELHMKRLLAGGFERIFQIGACHRAGDHGRNHREEFLMLEWYRTFADLNDIRDDLSGLLQVLAPFSKQPDYFAGELQSATVVELFEQHLDLRLTDCDQLGPLRDLLDARNLSHDADDDWDTLFFRLFLQCIEPKLGIEAPLLVTDYPASMSALAKLAPKRPGQMPTCHRFELFIQGKEIANAFYELTDPVEQRRRFEIDRNIRAKLNKPVYSIDEAFMAALESGLPPSAGIALGVDRLIMALLCLVDFDDLLPFDPV